MHCPTSPHPAPTASAYPVLVRLGLLCLATALGGCSAGAVEEGDDFLTANDADGGIDEALVGDVTLVPANATWRFREASAPSGWQAAAFSDSTWKAGRAELGFGEGDEATVVTRGTPAAVAFYFRGAFTVSNAAAYTNARVRLVRDDGAVVYLNGKEIARSNMPAGTVSASTLASTTTLREDERRWFEFTVPNGILVTGKNVLAVEVHQAHATSSDLSFNASVVATASKCVIGGVTYNDGAANPANPCQRCSPLQSTTAWSATPAGATCSDGQYCTVNDACNASGQCVGSARSCNDALACTSESCNEATDTCAATVTTGCAIANACVASGTKNPANACQQCDPALSPTAWSAVPGCGGTGGGGTTMGFAHPGVGVGKAQLDFVKAKIAAGAEPWKTAYAKLTGSYLMKLTRVPAPVPEVRCAASVGRAYIAAHPELGLTEAGCTSHKDDAAAAYGHALAWYYTGNRTHAQKSVELLNAWSGTLQRILFDQPRTDLNQQIFANGFHEAGWGGENFMRAAELMRHTFTPQAGEPALNVAKLESMFRNIYLPLTTPGGAGRGNWNGWGLNPLVSHMSATLGMAVFLNDRALFDAELAEIRRQQPAMIHLVGDDVSKYVNLAGMPQPPLGTIYDKATIARSAVAGIWNNPARYIDGIAGETCRDMSHTTMTFGSLGTLLETARLQNVDLYAEYEERLTLTLELHAAWLLAALDGKPQPANWPCAAALNYGGTGYRLGWELALNHYAGRIGLPMPNASALAPRFRPSGTGLHMNWETLTHYGTP